MRKVTYRIVPRDAGWAIETDGQVGDVAYVTREAALEAIVGAASREIAVGAEIEIKIPGRPAD